MLWGLSLLTLNVVLTGFQLIKVCDLLAMLAEILGFPFESVKFLNTDNKAHYITTPYSYNQKLGCKYTPELHIDLGQGLLQLIDEVKADLDHYNMIER